MNNYNSNQNIGSVQKPIIPDRPYVLFINTIIKTLKKLNIKYNESLIDDLWKNLSNEEKSKFFKIHKKLLKEYNQQLQIFKVNSYNNINNKKILFSIDLN